MYSLINSLFTGLVTGHNNISYNKKGWATESMISNYQSLYCQINFISVIESEEFRET